MKLLVSCWTHDRQSRCWKCPPLASRQVCTRSSIFLKVRWRVSGVIAWISLSMFFRKSCSVRGMFSYTRHLRMLHRKKSGGVKSGDRGGHSLLEMILSSKKERTHRRVEDKLVCSLSLQRKWAPWSAVWKSHTKLRPSVGVVAPRVTHAD
jgi:hypothetical protein